MQLTPEGLNTLYNAPLSATYQAQDLLGQLSQANEAENKRAGLANLFAEQNNPVLVEQNRLENQAKQARLPGLLAESENAQLGVERQRATQGDAIKAAQQKFLKEASDHDLTMLEHKAQRMAYSQDPGEREQGMNILRMHKDMIKQRDLTGDQYRKALDLENARGRNQRDLANLNNGAGRYAKTGKGAGGGSVEDQLASGKLRYEQAATLLEGAAFMAEQEGDDEKAAIYRAKADDFNRQLLRSKEAAGRAGAEIKPDLQKLGISPNAPTPAEPFRSKKAAVPEGLKDNGDGTFTMPDGRIVRRKQ